MSDVKKKKKRAFPHTYVIIFGLILFCALLTWVVPGGAFERETKLVNGIAREVVAADTFHEVKSVPQSWQVFTSVFEGMLRTKDIIFYILIIGGAFWIMNFTKAIDVAIYSFLETAKRLERYRLFRFLGINNLIITLIMLCFSFFGAVIGMSEETIAFVVIFIPLSIRMGYDSIVGVSMCFLAAALGFVGALLNPFTIGIAQGLAGIPLFSGLEYRLVIWFVINAVGIVYVLRYAKKIKKNPERSPVYQEDEVWRKKGAENLSEAKDKPKRATWMVYVVILATLAIASYLHPFSELVVGNALIKLPVIPVSLVAWAVLGFLSLRHSIQIFIVNILFLTIFYLIVGVMGYDWYIKEIASLFFVMGLLAGISFGIGPNRLATLFIEGVKDIVSAALVVGFATGIVVILEQGKIIDWLLFHSADAMNGYSTLVSVFIMYVFYCLLGLVIASGSAKAALTIPLMSQFSDLLGISRQVTVTVYQVAGNITPIISPTSGVMVGVLSIAKIPYGKWLKWMLPLFITLLVIGFLLMIPPLYLSMTGF